MRVYRVFPSVFAAAGIAFATLAVAASGNFTPASSLSPGRYAAVSARLANGTVLIAGGFNGTNLATAQMYDPATTTFAATTNNLSVARGFSFATILQNDKVLIAGGGAYDGSANVTNADLFDPATGRFSPTGALKTARCCGTTTLLGNGKVLVAGGLATDGVTRLTSAELYDPATATFIYTGSMATPRDEAVAALLPDGKVLVAGGGDGSGLSLKSAEIYDPVTGLFSATGDMTARRDDATATLLPSGKVLVACGIDVDIALGTAELYDPATGVFTASASTLPARRFASATLLPSGKVLIAGGVASDSNVGSLSDARLYDPASDTFTATGAMATARFFATANLLVDGRVLLAGGYNDAGVVATAELYGPVDEIFANGFEGP